jgi:hypothetical protein
VHEIVDLASGRVQALGVTGVAPSWSKDGTTIAYLATVPRRASAPSAPNRAAHRE